MNLIGVEVLWLPPWYAGELGFLNGCGQEALGGTSQYHPLGRCLNSNEASDQHYDNGRRDRGHTTRGCSVSRFYKHL